MSGGITRLRRLHHRSVAALIVLGCVGLFALDAWGSSIADHAVDINRTGRQRMRSAGFARDALRVRSGERSAASLVASARRWSMEQRALLRPERGLPEPVRSELRAANTHLLAAEEAARCLTRPACDRDGAFERIAWATESFIQHQDAAVASLAEAQDRERLATRVAGLAFGMGCGLLLLLQARFVIAPALSAAERSAEKLREARRRAESFAHDEEQRASELAEALRREREAVRLRERFVANVSHEVRTPLNGVLGVTRLLLDGALDGDQRLLAETAHRSGEALLRVVDDILDFSKLEAGKLELDRQPFDPVELVEDVAEVFAGRAQAKGLALVVQVDPAIPARLVGDGGRLRQVLSNLMSNAVKFTPEGTVVLALRVRGEASGRHRLRFSVRDTGPGISPEGQQQLFEPFVQVDGSNTRVAGGTGLGLSIARHLVAQMDGEVGVKSVEGVGTTFTLDVLLPEDPDATPRPAAELAGVTLLVVDPEGLRREGLGRVLRAWGGKVRFAASLEEARARAEGVDVWLVDDGLAASEALASLLEAADPRPAALLMASLGRDADAGFDARLTKPVRHARFAAALGELVGEAPAEDAETSGVAAVLTRAASSPPAVPRVLLVEDNPVNRLVAARFLARLGAEVEIAEDGAAALARIAEDASYDLVLMDCQMPVMDGLEATRRIRALGGRAATVPIVALTASAMAAERERCFLAGMNDFLSKPLRPEALDAVVQRWAGSSAAA
ncbi:MAG: ATP-binding protein [Myxococcota bacterium]